MVMEVIVGLNPKYSDLLMRVQVAEMLEKSGFAVAATNPPRS